MAKINVKEDAVVELDPKKELERQLAFIEEFYKDRPKYAARKAEIMAKLGALSKKPDSKS